jgi:hypothetical protein
MPRIPFVKVPRLIDADWTTGTARLMESQALT